MQIDEFCEELDFLLNEPSGTTTPETVLSETLWDSMTTLGFIAMAEREFDMKISPKRLTTCQTVADLAALLGNANAASDEPDNSPVKIVRYTKDNTEFTKADVLRFVKEQDRYFVPPLVDRGVDIDEYVNKLERQGEIFAAFDENKNILGIAMFYCNDHETQKAFATWMAVDPSARAQGVGIILVSELLAWCKSQNMKSFETSTWSTNKQLLAVYQLGFGAKVIDERKEFGRTTLVLGLNFDNP